ncbi:MAG: hypothetical protein ACQEP8_02240 [Chlamydiota bacterium]
MTMPDENFYRQKIYLYCAEYLLRTPSDEELNYGIDILQHKKDKTEALNFIRLSPEIINLTFSEAIQRIAELINSPQVQEILGQDYIDHLEKRTTIIDSGNFVIPNNTQYYDWIKEQFIAFNRPFLFPVNCQLAYELEHGNFTTEKITSIFNNDHAYHIFSLIALLLESPSSFDNADLDIVDIVYNSIQSDAASNNNYRKEYITQYHHDQQCKKFCQQFPQKRQKGILYVCEAGNSGYSYSAKQYILAIIKAGIPIATSIIKSNSAAKLMQSPSFEDKLLFYLSSQPIDVDTIIIHQQYLSFQETLYRLKYPHARIMALTVWEFEHLSPHHTYNFRNYDQLIVPCHWNREIFKKYLSLPVETIHHVLDTPWEIIPLDNKKHTQHDPSSRLMLDQIPLNHYCFLSVCTFFPRKGLYETIKAFLEAFNSNDPCTLYVKVTTPYFWEEYPALLLQYNDPPNIIVNDQHLTNEEMDALYDRCDCYLQLTKSEGVGLGCCQMAQRGKPVIITGYGGQLEYLKKAHYIPYMKEKVGADRRHYRFFWNIHPLKYYKDCWWAIPDQEAAVKLMRKVLDNREKEAQKSHVNAEHIAKHFSYERIGKKFLRLVDKHQS